MSEPREESSMSAEDALRTMASVTSMTKGLRVRIEGLTIAIFALCILASYLTIVVPILFGGAPAGPRGPGPGGRPPPTNFFLSAYAPLVWYVVAVAITVGVWRMMSLSFQTGMSTPRLLGVFVAWLLIFVAAIVLFGFIEAGNPREWHLLAWAIVVGLFAAVNPLRFSRQARFATAIMAVCALATFGYAWISDLPGRDIGFLTGVTLGLPGLVTGLWLMYRG